MNKTRQDKTRPKGPPALLGSWAFTDVLPTRASGNRGMEATGAARQWASGSRPRREESARSSGSSVPAPSARRTMVACGTAQRDGSAPASLPLGAAGPGKSRLPSGRSIRRLRPRDAPRVQNPCHEAGVKPRRCSVPGAMAACSKTKGLGGLSLRASWRLTGDWGAGRGFTGGRNTCRSSSGAKPPLFLLQPSSSDSRKVSPPRRQRSRPQGASSVAVGLSK